MQGTLTRRCASRGFSLVEMITVLILIGIVGAAFATFLSPAVRSFQNQTSRAALVDSAESALRRMARDIRIAVPNSIRITNTATGFALEMVPTVDGGRYCANGLADCTTSTQILDFTAADADFDILGCFKDASFVTAATAGTIAYRIAIGNAGNEIYSGSPAVISPAGTNITLTTTSGACGSGASRNHVTLGTAFQVGEQSARQRLFVVPSSAAPVSYICDWTAGTSGTLTRYSGYGFQAAQPTSAAAIGLASSTAVVASGIPASGCSITSTTGNVQSTGIVILSLSLTNAGETVTLVHEAPLDNSQ